ncbi:hypothetical protein CEXT_128341 [Caerostris extrusa]|uniref:Uncharacterized protein n=1 Tax=Caerostris extrusa TaxID=172846 RepID=A0AAV4XNH3_CAEEX|nr:hypothetical protein CEXT_128341 [Caerostris extrusa]
MEPSESVHAFNLESRRWKVREETGKDERGGVGQKINSCRRRLTNHFNCCECFNQRGLLKDLAGTPPGTARGSMERNTLKDQTSLQGRLVIVWKMSL